MSDESTRPPYGPPPDPQEPVWEPPPAPPGEPTVERPVGGPPRRRRGAIIAGVVAGVVAVGAAAGAFFLFKLAGTQDVHARMAPSTTDVYVAAFLDPAAGQKVSLGRLARKFPAVKEQLDRGVDTIMNEALKSVGLSFTGDVKPWLGSQVSFVVEASEGGGPAFASIIASLDDAAARAALTKAEQGGVAAGRTFRTEQHGGVEVRVGELGGGVNADPSSDQLAHAVFDGSAVVAAGPGAVDLVKSIIDTSQGRAASLEANANYTDTVAGLPDDVLGLAYVDVQTLGRTFLLESSDSQPIAVSPPPTLEVASASRVVGQQDPNDPAAFLRAIRGMAFSLTAAENGLLFASTMEVNMSAVPEELRVGFSLDARESSTLAFMPKDSYGAVTVSGWDQVLPTLLRPGTLPPDVELAFQRFDVREVIEHLNGDAGLEVGPGAGDIPGGAVLLGTDDAAGMQAFLDRLLDTILEESGDPSVQKRTEDHRGATITSVPIPDLAEMGIEPAYAVVEGMAILGSSPEEVRQAIDAQADGTNITTAEAFAASVARVDTENVSLLYADVRAILAAVRSASPETAAEIDQELQRNLDPLRATILSGSQEDGTLVVKWFFLIE